LVLFFAAIANPLPMSQLVVFRSDVIARAAYDEEELMLKVWLTNDPGTARSYAGVHAKTWDGLCSAPSRGEYFRTHIDSASAFPD